MKFASDKTTSKLYVIKHRYTDEVIFSHECGSLQSCVEAAVKKGVNLGGADLSGANFRGADLGTADLSYANLSYAGLSGANFRGANLHGANLCDADLTGADLTFSGRFGAPFTEE